MEIFVDPFVFRLYHVNKTLGLFTMIERCWIGTELPAFGFIFKESPLNFTISGKQRMID